jgi:hypothetical protein
MIVFRYTVSISKSGSDKVVNLNELCSLCYVPIYERRTVFRNIKLLYGLHEKQWLYWISTYQNQMRQPCFMVDSPKYQIWSKPVRWFMIDRHSLCILSHFMQFRQENTCTDGNVVQAACRMIKIKLTGFCVHFYVMISVNYKVKLVRTLSRTCSVRTHARSASRPPFPPEATRPAHFEWPQPRPMRASSGLLSYFPVDSRRMEHVLE